jgi:hypothetical protein
MQSLKTTANPERKTGAIKLRILTDLFSSSIYAANSRALLPLPEQDVPASSLSHVSNYPEFPVGSYVMALYPDTSCFYRAEVIATRAVDRVSYFLWYTRSC